MATAHPKLPLGAEPPPGSPDWGHRVVVRPAGLACRCDASPTVLLQHVGYPRPRTRYGWPLVYTGSDPDDPSATELAVELWCARERRCQVCGQRIEGGAAFAFRRHGHVYRSGNRVVPWVEGRGLLDARCMRMSFRYCPEVIRQARQGIVEVCVEPSTAESRMVDETLIDTSNFLPVILPVWPLEVARDRGDQAAALRLERAGAKNACARAWFFGGRRVDLAPGEPAPRRSY